MARDLRHTCLMSMSPVQEREIRRNLTPAEKFAREMQQFGAMSFRVGVLTLFLTPLLVTAILTIDIPARFLDRIFLLLPGVRPSHWLTWGGVIMTTIPLTGLLFARRYGGQEASRAILISWILVAVLVMFELSVLSPVIESGDFPGARFMIGLVAGAMSGQLVAVAFYDVLRGGGRWWRAPFYATITGLFVSAVIYFPIVYWASGLPWGVWMIGDLMVKTIFAALFLPVYAYLKRFMRPRGGYGG